MKNIYSWTIPWAIAIAAATILSCSNDLEPIPTTTEEELAAKLATVTVSYQGETAKVSIPEAYKPSVTATVEGAHVTLTNKNVLTEYEFRITGSTENGSLTYIGQYKTTFALDGISITNPAGAALDIQCGKRIALTLTGDNTLTDGAGEQKACLYCKGHLEIEGEGTLNIAGNARHGIATKEYLQLKRSCGTINILKAAADGIHAGQYFQMNGGTLNIGESTLGDGVQAEATNDPEDEHNGEIIVKGGTLNIATASEDCKAMKCDALFAISGGTFNIQAKGNGSRGMQTNGDMTINEEDGETLVCISAEGARCTQPGCAADPHRCMGMKIDGNLTINAGTVTVTNTGSKSRGIKCGSYTPNGGNVTATVTY